ncbi:MAG: cation:proton antiporter [Planctomycetota bacterium]|nr:MAG: cation:proton antiporter [Planctomycetota bacterium]
MIRFGRLVVALAALIGVVMLIRRWGDAIADRAGEMDPAHGATLAVGLLLFGSWLFGRLFKAIALPKLSGYLVFGMLVGPDALALIPQDQLPTLRAAETIAISLIALIAGGEIELAFLRRAARLILSIAILQFVGVFLSVAGLVWALAPAVGLTSPDEPAVRLASAALAGAIATAASPAVFIAIMNEVRARGDSVRASLSVMIAKDLGLIVLFTVIVAVASAGLRGGQEDPEGAGVALGLAQHLLGSIAAGAVFGLVFAWYMHAVRAHLAIFVIVGCVAIAVVSRMLHLEALIVALVAGLLMRNVWHERVGPVFDTMEDLSLPVYCVFFAVAGAKLDLGALGAMWPAALAIVAVRAGGVWLTTDLGCRLAGQGPPLRTWIWAAFIPQAGVSVALITVVRSTFEGHEFAATLYALVLATITFHELLGPILLRAGLVRLDAHDRAAGDSGAPPAEGTSG